MTDPPPENEWKTLNKDLERIAVLEQASLHVARPLIGPGVALAFMVIVGLIAAVLTGQQPHSLIVVAAAIIGAYMALNIGANDVANNMGPAVGAQALTLGGALVVAAVFETAGALLGGGDVIDTVSRGIVAPEAVAEPAVFIWAMMSALLAGALWINLATWLGAPVSTTHSIVGGVVGAGIAAAGLMSVNWPTMGAIAASWVISPLMGGVLAAAILAFIKTSIIYTPDILSAARRWVPLLIGVMGGAFAIYLSIKGVNKVLHITPTTSALIGLGTTVVLTLAMRPVIRRQSRGLENRKKSLKVLFSIPLVCSAALLSFAHGANDVANAVGPLAAIVTAVNEGRGATESVAIPLWIMAIGAAGLSLGLLMFGPRMIRMVGSQITRLNAVRAYCVALSAAITVIIASWLGLPVSSTHIAIGGIFGVGFFREWYHERILKKNRAYTGLPPEERARRKLVRRSHFLTIVAAWVVTVPATAGLAALLFMLLHLIPV
ncbi:inorganic phosphate transporter [Roseicitreum antarcticum]|uniref:Phosphate transporter n=1 Tax=Roseicitreum antarcticum TaxID=564137 RepID=A0A1H2R7K4_9RHOB|nr:inorganic phosphate transporter [Roseicitreum antarcticum]SDW15295.1 inorganic phosphate transporter, PiT family [Roseicitreum antarcticum]